MTQPASSDVRVGSVLRDTYEIVSLLGKGGMGAVFLARHLRLKGKQVAIKVLLNSASLNPELYARFQREAEIASQLGHPNIVEVIDFDTLPDGTPFLVMEYLRGESLEQRLERGPLPLAETLGLTRQVGSALQAAHRAGIIHRDLKPANVFLVPTDSGGVVGERVKLLDFGISKMVDSQTLQTQDSVLIGTPQYMAPEQALGKNSEIDARTDLFALGCIVYEMLAGRPPFAAEPGLSIVQVIFRIVHMQPEPLGSLCLEAPESVLSAVNRALSKTPDDRFVDVAAFVAALTGTPLRSLPGMAMPASLAARNQVESASTGRFGAEDLASTHMPSSTARFATPSPAAAGPTDELGLGSTHLSVSPPTPVSTARLSLAPPPAPVVPSPVAPAPVDAPPPSSPPARHAMPKGVLAGAWLVVLGALGAGAWWFTRSPPAPLPAPPMVVQAPVAPSAPVAPVPPAEKAPEDPAAYPGQRSPAPDPSPPTPRGTEPDQGETVSAPVGKSPSRKPDRNVAKAPMTAELRRLLAKAEAALEAEDANKLESVARELYRQDYALDSFGVQLLAHCMRKDLSNVNATWPKAKAGHSIRHVRKYCRQKGFDLK
ncbi:serine/threonine-protein kinase [Archangium primigenium]|uniref:serine/threonine-protein kinase n=1 Tax=[Archangium] primigenium TaxID=2792470 RepID=UPI00195AA7E4|nr:serine/threonine-protein kinase [Archangium primigenium]MBM7115229.1 serine/threonine protein kinase [Archangium primigenium]